jgi:hypothetical protein
MTYLAWIKREDFIKLKSKKGIFSVNIRIYYWIKHLSNIDNFNTYFNKEDYYDDNGLQSTREGKKQFTIELNKEDWDKFKYNCSKKQMSANYAINKLVADYAKGKKQHLFNINIKM